MEFKRGQVYRDQWGRIWKVVNYDDTTGYWIVKMLNGGGITTYYNPNINPNKWELISNEPKANS